MRFDRRDRAMALLSLGILLGAGSFLYGGNDAAPGEPAAPNARRAEDSSPTGKTELVRERYTSQAVKLERSIAQDANLNFVNHGPWTMWDPAGNLSARGEYRMGKRHGAWQRWYIGNAGVKSGDPAQKSTEAEDAFTGPEFEGFTRPFLSEARFDNDKLTGTWTIVDAEGKQISSVDLDHDVLNGKAISWFANGVKQREITLRQGVIDGYWKEWDADKNLVRNDHYIDGCRLAEAVLTFDSGEKSSEGVYLYAKDVIKADLDWWKGRLDIQSTPGEGKQAKQGKWTYWYQTGEKRCDAEYLDDKPVNTHVWWYRNGQKECEGRYLDGQPHATWTYWHENGLQGANGEYNKGARIGRWMRWSPEGKVVENVDHGAGQTASAPGRHYYAPGYGKAVAVPPPPSTPVSGANPPPLTTTPAPRTARAFTPANTRR